MRTSPPRQVGGRELIDTDPDQLVWILSARESADRAEQLENQLVDLRAFVRKIGGRVDREVPENAVSSYQKTRIQLPDGTDGYRVVRPDWESILTALRRRECNALAVADIDRATRDPRLLEDLIEVVEHYSAYVVSLTGNINLNTDAGIDAARGLVNQRNQESRNKSRKVTDGKRHAAMKGKNSGGPYRPFGWRKDRIHVNKREAAHIRREIPRIRGGVSPLTLAQEWTARGIPTVTGLKVWRQSTIAGIFLNPRLCGLKTLHGDILYTEDGEPVHGVWEAIISQEEHDAIVNAWKDKYERGPRVSRLGAKGTGYRTKYLLSPFIRCGNCNARMLGTVRPTPSKRTKVEIYRCPGKGMGGCGRVSRKAEPINEYIKTLVIKEHQRRVPVRAVEDLPPWPKTQELKELQERIEESTRRYEAGEYRNNSRYFSSLARMESQEAELKREKRAYEAKQKTREQRVTDLAKRWDAADFTMEQKQAAIAETLTAVIIKPSHKGAPFHPDLIDPVWREETDDEE